MGNYIRAYIRSVEAALADENTDLEKLKEEHLKQIGFIQHERLIHLIVTVFVGIVLFIGMVLFFVSEIKGMLAMDLLLLILTFCYLGYYYFIENAVQKLYRLYNRMVIKCEEQTAGRLCDNKEML